MQIHQKIMPEEESIEVINTIRKEEWNQLLNLIPEIEKTDNFGKPGGLKKYKDGTVSFPFYIHTEIVNQFVKIAYDTGIIIPFDWSGWKQGQVMFRDNDFDFDSVDVFTKCKLITAIVRADRFSDGVLIEAFRSGLILKVLKSIDRQVN